MTQIQKSRVFTDYRVIFDDKRLYLDMLSKSLVDLYAKKVEKSKNRSYNERKSFWKDRRNFIIGSNKK